MRSSNELTLPRYSVQTKTVTRKEKKIKIKQTNEKGTGLNLCCLCISASGYFWGHSVTIWKGRVGEEGEQSNSWGDCKSGPVQCRPPPWPKDPSHESQATVLLTEPRAPVPGATSAGVLISLITARDDLSAHAQQSAVKRSRGWVDSLSGERNEDFENRILLGQERLPVTEQALGKTQSTWYNNSFKRLARSLSLAASSTKQFLFLLSFSENRLLCSYKIITHKKKRCLITGRTGWFLLYSFSFTVYISLNEPFCVCASLL